MKPTHSDYLSKFEENAKRNAEKRIVDAFQVSSVKFTSEYETCIFNLPKLIRRKSTENTVGFKFAHA